MKLYIGSFEKKSIKYGYEFELSLYKYKKGDIEFLGYRIYRSGSYKGHESEAMDILLETKEITKKEYNKSKGDGNGGGYYYISGNRNFRIRII